MEKVKLVKPLASILEILLTHPKPWVRENCNTLLTEYKLKVENLLPKETSHV